MNKKEGDVNFRVLNLALAVHNHQPVENDDKVIEKVYRMSYAPFLERLSNFPDIKVNLHYSGYLLEWIAKNHPEFVDLLKEMVCREQIEIIGGGYYEPILPVIPDRDALGQISLLNEKIGSLFGVRPKGLWLAERAWEPNLPEILFRAGIRFTFLDDSVFRMVGISEKECFRPFLTESRGSSVVVFPILKKLRYYIPFKAGSRTISFLRNSISQHNSDQQRIAVFGDDGEKFGAWPTTYEEVYGRRWLENFFGLVLKNRDWLRTVRLSDYLSNAGSFEKTYLPASSYPELMEWSLPTKADNRADDRLSTGFWRLFLSKYGESARLYSRMLNVSHMVNRISNSSEKKAALKELWKSQYNDVYWHGIFGGLYFPKFRRVAYHHLLRAQTIAEKSLHGNDKEWITVQRDNSRYRMDTCTLGLSFSRDLGGSVTEIDYKPHTVNLTDCLARRYETYHDKIVREVKQGAGAKRKSKVKSIHEFSRSKEAGLKDLLIYDRYPKFSFLDYILEEDSTIKDFQSQKFVEVCRLAGHPYRFKEENSTNSKSSLVFSRPISHGSHAIGEIRKKYTISRSESEFSVRYDLKNLKREVANRLFAVEINLAAVGDLAFERKFGSLSEYSGNRSLGFEYKEPGFSVSLGLDRNIKSIWRIPIKSVSQSESGFESNLQGISLIPNFEIQDPEKIPISFELGISMKKI